MAKWLCFVVFAILLFPMINEGKNEKSEFIHSIKNHAPVALMEKYRYQSIVGKEILFKSVSYDPDGDALQYRWDFDNDGIYDTPWIKNATISHVYLQPYNGFVKMQVRDENGIDESIARVNAKAKSMTLQEVDQKQEKADGYAMIYEDKFYAQSFKPSLCGLNGIDLLLARHGLSGKILKELLGKWVEMFNIFLGDLVIGIYGKLGDIYFDESVRQSKVFETRISPEEIPRTATWSCIGIEHTT